VGGSVASDAEKLAKPTRALFTTNYPLAVPTHVLPSFRAALLLLLLLLLLLHAVRVCARCGQAHHRCYTPAVAPLVVAAELAV